MRKTPQIPCRAESSIALWCWPLPPPKRLTRSRRCAKGIQFSPGGSVPPQKYLHKWQFENHVQCPCALQRNRHHRRVLIVVDSLREDYDFPPISVVAICTNVVSVLKFYQFIGRGLRLVRSPTVEQNVDCDIVYHGDAHPHIGKLLEMTLFQLVPTCSLPLLTCFVAHRWSSRRNSSRNTSRTTRPARRPARLVVSI